MTINLKLSIPEDTLKTHKYVIGNIGDDLLLFAAAKRTETRHKLTPNLSRLEAEAYISPQH